MRSSLGPSVVFLTLLGLPSAAQETTGDLRGRLVDEVGSPVPGADVTASSPRLQGVQSTRSTEDGTFWIPALPVGTYEIRVARIGFQEMTVQDVVVRLGRTTVVPALRLETRVLELPPVVVSVDRVPLMDATSTDLGTNLGAEDYGSLPIERDYQSVSLLLPHANESFLGDEVNIGGATGYENKYFIDGVDVTEAFQGKTGTRLPYNFVREVQVRTGAYEAEYRSSLGGIVNVVTHGGSDEFEGQVFGFFANNRLAGDSRLGAYELKSGDYALYDFGFGLAGPMARDQLWFHVAYNASSIQEDVDVPGHGWFEDRETRHSFAGRLNWRVDDRNDLTLSVFGDPGTRDAVGDAFNSTGRPPETLLNPDPFLTEVETGGINVSLRGRHRVGGRLLLESTLSFVSQKNRNEGIDDLLFVDEEASEWSGGPGVHIDTRSRVQTAGLNATLARGRHILKAGVEYRDNRASGSFGYHNLTRYSSDFYWWAYDENRGTIHNRQPSAFVQDSWQLHDRLLVNAGLRWDGQYVVRSGGGVAQSITDQWQPRIGVVLQPGEPGTQKVTASYGRFYQELSTLSLLAFYGSGEDGFWLICDRDPEGDAGACDPLRFYPQVDDLEGQYFDELTLGYERLLTTDTKLAIRGIYRSLGQAVEDGFEPGTDSLWLGNPGRGRMADFPPAERRYRALEVTLQHRPKGSALLLVSYVLSRNEGNHMGIYNSDWGTGQSNYGPAFDEVAWLENADGLLPNDRTHVFKLAGSHPVGLGVTGGLSFTWQSGTPISDFGPVTPDGLPFGHLSQRGSRGRTPSIWDLNLRVQWDLARWIGTRVRPRLILDLRHVGSRRDVVNVDQVHYFGMDAEWNSILPNPNYLRATSYQPPMALRLGVEMSF